MFARISTYSGDGDRLLEGFADVTEPLQAIDGFSLALGPTDEEIKLPRFLHFGKRLPSPDEVRRFRDRLAAAGVEIVEEWDEPEYVSVKCRDPDGYVVEASWEP